MCRVLQCRLVQGSRWHIAWVGLYACTHARGGVRLWNGVADVDANSTGCVQRQTEGVLIQATGVLHVLLLCRLPSTCWRTCVPAG
jgi:hypothetical protein